SAAGLQLAPEILELPFGETPLEKCAGVDAGRCVPLIEDDVTIAFLTSRTPEMVEPHLVQRRRGCESGNVAADARLDLVRPNHHRDGIPANDALDAPFNLLIARKRRFLIGRNRIDKRGVGAEWKANAATSSVLGELLEKLARSSWPVALEDVIERV